MRWDGQPWLLDAGLQLSIIHRGQSYISLSLYGSGDGAAWGALTVAMIAALAQQHCAEKRRTDEELLDTARLSVLEAPRRARATSQLWTMRNELTKPHIRAVSVKPTLECTLALLPITRSQIRTDVDEEVPLVMADERWRAPSSSWRCMLPPPSACAQGGVDAHAYRCEGILSPFHTAAPS